MRRALPVAMLSVLLAIAPAALAQHSGAGGGREGSGIHGGFSAGRSFGGFAPHYNMAAPRYNMMARHYNMAAPRYNMMAPRYGMANRAYAPYFGAERGAWNRGDGNYRDRRGRYRHEYYGNYGGYNYGYPYFINSWELLPWDLNGDDMSSGDNSGSQQAAAQQQQQPEYSQEPEYGPGPDEGYREDYAPPPPQGMTGTPAVAQVTPEPKLTLIFKDGHTEEVRNYMLTPQALIDLDEASTGRELQIPLASLNLPATEQAAQAAGLQFAPPVS